MYGASSLSPGSQGPPVMIWGWTLFRFVVTDVLLVTKETQYTVHSPAWGKKTLPLQYCHEEDFIPMTMKSLFSTNSK